MLSAPPPRTISRRRRPAHGLRAPIRAPDEQPLRAELFSVGQLERHAATMAGWHELAPESGRRRGTRSEARGADRLLTRLGENASVFVDAYALLTEAVGRGRQITPAAEWFIDNYHLIDDQIRTARVHLPRSYSRELPRLVNAPIPGTPRAYELALELISHSHGRVDIEGLEAFIVAYQAEKPLRLGELWAVPIMLRLALLENLRRVVVSVTRGRRERERAQYWAGEMIDVTATDPARLVLVIADMVEEAPALGDAFVAELATRLRSQGAPLQFAMSWLEQRLAEQGQTVEHIFDVATQSQAADQVSISNSIGSLRFLGTTDWRLFVEAMSVVERTLRTDPSGDYPTMDFTTRDRYRHVIEAIAKRSAVSEHEVAAHAIRLAREAGGQHLGQFLLPTPGRRALERAAGVRNAPALAIRAFFHARRRAVYAGAVLATSTLIVCLFALAAPAFLGASTTSPALAVLWWTLAAFVALQVGIGLVHTGATLLVGPKILPRLDFTAGIPPAYRTVVAVPAMLTSPTEIDELVEALEVRFLANRDRHLAYALLGDFRDAPTETTPADDALLTHASRAILALNDKYSASPDAHFILLHRARRWNPSERMWMGWERKRGKLEEFNAELRALPGDAPDARFATIVGPVAALEGIRYVIALDADTALPRDAARLMAGTLAHPLNRAVYDPALGRVSSGYAILQPRVGVSMTSASRTRFARLFAGEPGIDPYTRAVSDVFQDVFDAGSFIGKGIYDVDALALALAGRLPENRVLSHDLLEGAYAGCGLVSDVVLVEDFPAAHAAEVARRTRWIRGDWQIAAWLGRRVPSASANPGPGPKARVRNPIARLSKWKILDNLRRSLVPCALAALLALGWVLPGAAATVTIAVLGVLVLPGLMAAATALGRRPREQRLRAHLHDVGRSFLRQLGREAFGLATLPYDAYLATQAIATTMVRLYVTHRKLLVWRTASDAQRAARTGLAGSFAAMWFAPTFALALSTLTALLEPRALLWAAPFLALWLLAPALAWWLSRPLRRPESRLTADDVTFLRTVARRTWRYFETFVGPDDHHLPPDNVQEDPPVGTAHRTSPTNIGVSLTSHLAAFDLGYLTAAALVARTDLTFATMDRLRRHRGHFLNWYDTATLEPLHPMYISTVDSGNLAAHLLTLASGLDELAERAARADFPMLGPQIAHGLTDTLAVLADELAADPTPALQAPLTHARAALAAFIPSAAAAAAADWHRLLTGLASDAAALLAAATIPESHAWAETFARAIQDADAQVAPSLPTAPRVADLRIAARRLAAHARALAEFDYAFLYDPTRHLLAVGYSVTDHRVDASNYDLLASEARLASFVAIAQGKLPQEHWFSLGRQLTATGGHPTLLSWSGSMFEYLMPLLVMPTYAHTLLDETYAAVIARQIAYGRERNLPWGVSESGYYKFDANQSYQYRAFGVPGLGFKRGLGIDRVVAPYASALALMVAPEAACANLQRLAREGQLGAYGFYEAIDYTPARLPAGTTHVTIRSFMAHHQGMTLLALVHVLGDRPMQRRFEADLALRSTDLLLQERVPRATAIYPHPPELALTTATTSDQEHALRVFTTPTTPAPEVHMLSNGRYHVVVTNAGSGYSRWRDLAVTRWREDPTRDAWGSFGYLRDLDSNAFWSLGHQPTLRAATRYEAIFSQGRAEFRRVDAEIETHVEISVSPEDDVELRRVTLTNRGKTPRTIELTSYAEVVLARAAADDAHPAFSNLFVQTELVRDQRAIVVTRRPRSGEERPPWMFHHMTVLGTTAGETSYETARCDFLGRGRSPIAPVALERPTLGDSEGAVLDPIVAIRQAVILEPHATAHLHLVTGIAETRADAMALIEKYRDRHAADRVFELSWTHSQVVQRRLDASNLDIQRYERLASNVLYSNPTLRAPRGLIAQNRTGQSGLWAYGISGDLPLVLLRIAELGGLELVRQLVKAHAFWRLKGLSVDLVIWIEDPSGYRQVLMDEIMVVVASIAEPSLLDTPGGIFIRRSEQISEPDKVLVQTIARVILTDTAGTLAEQLERRPRAADDERGASRWPLVARPLQRPSRSRTPVAPAVRDDLRAFNGLGGFTQDGKEYVITTTRHHRTGAPWVNVLANPWFGTIVSESGSAYTWCENAHSYRLTPWSNDAVTDPSGEILYLRDEEDGHFWTPTPLPAGAPTTHVTRHGFGYSVFESGFDQGDRDIATKLTTYVATDAPVKFLVLKIRNHSGRHRRLSLTAFFELVLGDLRASTMPHVVTELDPKTHALFARNAYNGDFAARVAFLDASELERSVAGDRREILGRNGDPARPACMRRPKLSGRVGAALDPCLAMQVTFDLVDGQEREIAFTFGSGRDLADARILALRFRGIGPAHAALEGVCAHWNRTLGAVHVETPDPALDVMANGWLVYQTIAARLWARSGFYQSGGAYGFRDQLQDAMALVHTEPTLLRAQILRAAQRQFRQGDVQHWWHPPQGRGVRTHISDDYLWLPYALCRYVTTIGDTGVLDEQVAFLDGRAVKPDEDSYYDLPLRSDETGTLYEHCVRAVRHGLRFGARGLPLVGSGDWNDGMNLLGHGGQGESVWLGFFLYDVLVQFGALAKRRGDLAFDDTCVQEAARLRANLEAHGWDGEWYRRAYFDDGEPLGSALNAECQIDSIPQSWAVLSGAGDPDRTKRALAAVDARLVRRDLGVVQLFAPPFDTSDLKPGYVKGYVPGVRENGGQYTHAAVWAAMAFAAAGDTARAWELFQLINPVRHGDTPEAIAVYTVEPYVVAADVYCNPRHAGRGGWTWYTGSAGWMYRLILESLLGLHLEVDRLRIAPRLPAEWPGFAVRYRFRDTLYHIAVTRRAAPDGLEVDTDSGGARITHDGIPQPADAITLVDDRRDHRVEVAV